MPDLTTISGVEAELAATARYDVDGDVDMAKRRVAALRRKLDFPAQAGRSEQSVSFQLNLIENELNRALAFVRANTTPTAAQLTANPSVVHADWSTFGRYRGGA